MWTVLYGDVGVVLSSKPNLALQTEVVANMDAAHALKEKAIVDTVEFLKVFIFEKQIKLAFIWKKCEK